MTTTIHTNGRRAAAPSPTNGIEAQLVDLQIEALVGEIRAISEQMEVLENSITAKKDKLRVLLTGRGENWQDENGYARLMKDSTRTSYDAKALDDLSLSSPWWHKRLNKFRRSFSIRGGVQVR